MSVCTAVSVSMKQFFFFLVRRLKFPLWLYWVRELLNDRLRAESDGSSDKHTGNERERLMDSTSLPLMGSGLTLLMRERER